MPAFVISLFRWEPFEELTGNPESGLQSVLAEAVIGKAKQFPFAGLLPKGKPAAEKQLRMLLTQEDWFETRRSKERELLAKLVDALLNGAVLKLGLEVEQVGICGGFELAGLIAGQCSIDKESSTPAFARYEHHMGPSDKEFKWLACRPFRYPGWEGSNDDMMNFEEGAASVPYSIHTPAQVKQLLEELESVRKEYAKSPYEELRDGFADLHPPLQRTAEKGLALYARADY